MKVKFITGSWTNDDVDLLPTVKLRTGSRYYMGHPAAIKIRATSIALCWLKWGVMVSFGRTFKSEQNG